jgi:hypothetical protein
MTQFGNSARMICAYRAAKAAIRAHLCWVHASP